MSAGVDGLGTTITFPTSEFSANIIDVDGPSMERGAIDVTHMGTTTAMTFIPAKIYDGGSVNITFEFNGGDDPPIDQAAEAIVIDWAGSNGTGQHAFSGFMTNYKPGAKIGDRMTAEATLKCTGGVTISEPA